MFNKFLLLQQTVETLKKGDFEVFVTSGCFDVAARREYLLLLKVLFNMDSFSEEHALSLRSTSYFLSGYPFIVSVRSTRYFLDDNTVYSKFSLPVVTPKLLEKIVTERPPVIEASKGKLTAEIDAELLRKKRMELGYTIEELAKKVGISKKALYEIEHKRVEPSVKNVEKLEKIIDADLRVSFNFKEPEPAYLKPKDDLEKKVSQGLKKMGVDNSCVRSLLFNLVGREKFSLITSLFKGQEKMDENIRMVKKLASIVCSKVLFIAKRPAESLEDVPLLLESDLFEMSKKEFQKLIKAS